MSNILSRLWRAPAPERKRSRVAPLIALQGQGRAMWSGRDYASLTREGFEKNPIAHRAARLVAEAAASVPLDASDKDAEKLLHRPNPRQAGSAFLESLHLQLILSGNAYVECVALDGSPRELFMLRSDRMRVSPGPDGWAESYDYTVGGRTIRFAAGEGPPPILHLAQTHPLDDHYGLSSLAPAASAIDIHNEATRWNKALLDNAARPSGALVYAAEGANMTDVQFDRLRGELEENFAGSANAGRPLLLEGGLDWKPMALTPQEMDFIALKNVAAREIALAIGVPPLMLGLSGDNTHANFAEANRAFWRQTVVPLVTRTAESLSAFLSDHLGGEVTLTPNFDGVDAMTDIREPLWRVVTAADFLSEAEKRQALGYPAERPPSPSGEGAVLAKELRMAGG
ncbi:MAG: phage portal protein [Beijerinckiaceae bacterium]